MSKKRFGIKQPTMFDMTYPPKKITNNNHLIVCKQMTDVKLNC